MKKMKKWLVMLAVSVLAVFTALAVGCGKEKTGETFKYSDVEVTSNLPYLDAATLEPAYEASYSGSTLQVTDKEFIVKNSSGEGKMQYRKEGDKYVLLGEEAEKAIASMNQPGMFGDTTTKAEYYAEKTESAWAIVLKVTATNPALSGEYELVMRVLYVK